MTEKLWYLKHCDLFERLSAEEIGRVELRSRVRTFEAQSPIYLPAQPAEAVYLLASGCVKICHLTEDGKVSILAFVQPGELFGELAIVGADQRDEYVEAVEKSTVVMIPADEIQRLMREHPDVSLGVTKLIGLKRQRIERRLKSLLYSSNRQRLIHLLLDLAEEFGQPTGEGILLGIRLSHQELASVIGVTRETVTLTLGQLRLEGMVKASRRRIVLADPQRLAQSVGRSAVRLPRPAPRLAPALSGA